MRHEYVINSAHQEYISEIQSITADNLLRKTFICHCYTCIEFVQSGLSTNEVPRLLRLGLVSRLSVSAVSTMSSRPGLPAPASASQARLLENISSVPRKGEPGASILMQSSIRRHFLYADTGT